MSATNSLTSLGLYIAYSTAMRLSNNDLSLSQVKQLGDTIRRAVTLNSLTSEDRSRLLKAAASAFFFLYLLSSYEQSAKNKRMIAEEMKIIKQHVELLNSQKKGKSSDS